MSLATASAREAVDWPALQAAKIAALLDRMAAERLDALVLQDMHGVRWATAYSPFMRILPPAAQVAVVVPPGRVMLVPIPFYVDDARRRAPWLEVLDPASAGLAATVAKAVEGARRVGLAGVGWDLAGALAAAGRDLVDGARIVAACRADKVAGERECVERAIGVAQVGMDAARRAIAPGVSEEEVAAEAESAMRRLGGDSHAIVGRGDIAARMTELAGPARFAPGDCVLVDLGCYLDGYRGEFARTYCVSEPRPGLVDAHAATCRAIDAAGAVLGAGVPAADVADAARRSLEGDGYPAATLPYPVGHGIGVSGGEIPAVERGSGDLVPSRAVVNLEPGVFDPARALAVRIEDAYAVDAGSVRRLTTTTRDLEVCG